MGVFIGNGFGQITVVFSTPGAVAPFVVTHGFKDTPGTGLASAAAAAWVTALTAANRILAATNVSSSYTIDRVDATIGTPTGPVLASQSVAQVGAAVFNPVPINAAELMRKTTARGGRRGRGRNFWPPMHVDESNVGPTGTIASVQLSLIQGQLNSTLTALQATSYPPYLLHDVSEVAPDAVTAWTMQARMATQRTRLRK